MLLGSLATTGKNTIVLSQRPNTRLRKLIPSGTMVWMVPGLLYAIPPFSFAATLLLLLRSRACGVFTVVGADLLDGAYWVGPSVRRLLIPAALARLGVSSEIVGFSWRRDPAPQCARALLECATAVSLRPRDEMTLERLRALGITGAKEGIDLALGIVREDQDSNTEFLDWAQNQCHGGKKILAFGPNGQTLARLAEIDALLNLVYSDSDSWALAIVPMDERFAAFDRTRAKFIAKRAQRMGITTFVFSRRTSVRELIASLEMVDAVFTFRMHLAVLALGVGVPSIGVDYNDKFKGIFRHFGVEEFVIDHPDLLNKAAEVWTTLQGRYAEVAATIRNSEAGNRLRVEQSFMPVKTK